MKRANLIRFVAVSVLLVLWPAKSPARHTSGGPAKEYVLRLAPAQAGVELRFVPQGEKGYVVKQASRKAGISALAGTLFLEEGRVQPIGGLNRRGVWIVENEGPASRNEDTMRSLRSSGQVAYAAPLFTSNGETVAIIPEIVIRVKPGIEMDDVRKLCEKAGCTIKKRMEFTTQEYLLEVLGPDAEAVFAAVQRLGKSPEVEWACPNTASRPRLAGETPSAGDRFYAQNSAQGATASTTSGVFPNDPYFPKQWHLHNTGQSDGTPGADIRAPEAWEITTGDPNIVIAVIDSGVDSKHPDLINNLVPGYDFYDNDAQPDPALDHRFNAHGTCCAGVAAAEGNNALGVSGVTWNCKIMPIRWESFASDGKETWITDSDVAEALRWAAAHGAGILSNSWGFFAQLPATHSAIMDVTRKNGIGRHGNGCIVLASSGNDNGPVNYPARYPEVIAVGGADHNDVRCYCSNYGPELDIVATSSPGCTIEDRLKTEGRRWLWTTDISGPAGWNMDPFEPNVLDYTGMGGTSAACPVAAGVAALILSLEPNLTGDEVRHFLERSAKDLGAPGRDDYYGWGRVDARAALDMVLTKRADLNNDWKVDFSDFAVFAQCWKTDDLRGDIGPIPRPDGVLDVQDLALMGEYWLKEIPELGLIAHWRLDETEGDIAHERVQKLHGTLHGGTMWQPSAGMVNGALQFDGSDDYLSTPFVLNPAEGAFSVFAWVKGGGPGQVIISQTDGTGWGSMWLGTDSTGGKLMTTLMFFVIPLQSECVVTDGGWHRVGVVWDGSRRHLYADGQEVAKDTMDFGAGIRCDGGLHIGAGKGLEAGSFWTGLIDDVKVYDRAVKP